MTLAVNDAPATPDELKDRELSSEALEAITAGAGTPSPEPTVPPHFPLPIPLPA
jgi:hypothetical protein